MTYFGPANFTDSGTNGLTISLDVKLEKDATFQIGLANPFVGLFLDSQNGTFKISGAPARSGKAAFAVGSWHKVSMTSKNGVVTATLDGVPLSGGVEIEDQTPAVMGAAGHGGYYVQMSLDRYVFADVDNFQLSV